MSLLNLVAAVLEPQYPCVFLVQHGDDVPEALRAEINGVIGGAVAVGKADSKLLEEEDSVDPPRPTVIGVVSQYFASVSNISVSDISRN